jgi:transposase
VFAISKKLKKGEKKSKKRIKKEKEKRFERLQGVVLRICYQKFHVHILSWC